MKFLKLYGLLVLCNTAAFAKSESLWEEMDRHFKEMHTLIEKQFQNVQGKYKNLKQEPTLECDIQEQKNVITLTLTPHNVQNLENTDLDLEFKEHNSNLQSVTITYTIHTPEQKNEKATPLAQHYSSSYSYSSTTLDGKAESSETTTENGTTKIIQRYMLPQLVDSQKAEIKKEKDAVVVTLPVIPQKNETIHISLGTEQEDKEAK